MFFRRLSCREVISHADSNDAHILLFWQNGTNRTFSLLELEVLNIWTTWKRKWALTIAEMWFAWRRISSIQTQTTPSSRMSRWGCRTFVHWLVRVHCSGHEILCQTRHERYIICSVACMTKHVYSADHSKLKLQMRVRNQRLPTFRLTKYAWLVPRP